MGRDLHQGRYFFFAFGADCHCSPPTNHKANTGKASITMDVQEERPQSSLSQTSREYSTLPTPKPTTPNLNAAGLPALNVDLRAHKIPLAIPWIVLLLTACIIPIAGFYALHFGTDVEENIQLAPWLGLFGVSSLHSLFTRTWRLIKNTNGCRPLGQSSAIGLDFFGWNFIFGFVVLTVAISLGIALEILELASIPLSILILYICLELLICQAFMAFGIRAPFRISSIARGATVKPGVYVIAEDVVAVDAKQGRAFREAWQARYEASPAMRSHLRRLDLMWGASGLVVVAVIFGVVFGVENKLVWYGVGWALPWAWAGTLALITFKMGSNVLRRERELQQRNGSEMQSSRV